LTDIAKMKKLIGEITSLEILNWREPKTSVWINKVLRFLKSEFGENSDYYEQFYDATHGTKVVSSGTTEGEFQRRHLDRLQRYKGYLQDF